MLVLIIGIGTHALYQVRALQDQLDEVTRTLDKMDSRVKLAQHEKGLFYSLARDVLALAPKNPNAEQIVVDFKLRELKAAQPTLFDSAPTKAPTDSLSTQANTVTNVAPETPAPIPAK